jgi:hypothetical protein
LLLGRRLAARLTETEAPCRSAGDRHHDRLHRIAGNALVCPQINVGPGRMRLDPGKPRLAQACGAGRSTEDVGLSQVDGECAHDRDYTRLKVNSNEYFENNFVTSVYSIELVAIVTHSCTNTQKVPFEEKAVIE